jgi:hypothetical protein
VQEERDRRKDKGYQRTNNQQMKNKKENIMERSNVSKKQEN